MQDTELITKKQKLRTLAGKIKWQIISLLLFSFDSMVLSTIRSADATKNKGPKKRLVFIRMDAIGDFILWTSSLEGFLTLYPKHEYNWTLVGNALWTDLAKELGVFDEIFPVESNLFGQPRGVKYRKSILAQLKRAPADVVIHPTHSRDFSTGDALARAIPAEMKIASMGDNANASPWQKAIGNRFYSQILPVKNSSPKNPTMELMRSAEFLSALSGKTIKATKPDLRKVSLGLHCDLPKEPYFVIFPGAGWRHREWGFEKFTEVAKDLQQKYGWLCVFCGSDKDRENFSSSIRNSDLRNLNRTGETTLTELIGLIANAKAVVANETSAAHIGAACHVPTVCITGGGHYNRFAPWRIELEDLLDLSCVAVPMPCFNCNWNCIYSLRKDNPKPTPCIANIEAKQVIQRVHQAIEESI